MGEFETPIAPHTCGWCTVALGAVEPFSRPEETRRDIPVLLTPGETRPSAAEYTTFVGLTTGLVAALIVSIRQETPNSIFERRALRWGAVGALGGFAIGKLKDALREAPSGGRAEVSPSPD